VTDHPEIPEGVREYFGHDKVAFHGRGGMPAAPPAPPGSTARKAGETAVADALSRVGSTSPRPGQQPAVVPPKPALPRVMRANGEKALLHAAQRRFGRLTGAPAPQGGGHWFWRAIFAPTYKALPWGIKSRMAKVTSGVKNYRS
jgi:hypothetical protein